MSLELAYPTFLQEYEIPQEQVEELLQMGLIPENMSPCVVPDLITLKKDEN